MKVRLLAAALFALMAQQAAQAMVIKESCFSESRAGGTLDMDIYYSSFDEEKVMYIVAYLPLKEYLKDEKAAWRSKCRLALYFIGSVCHFVWSESEGGRHSLEISQVELSRLEKSVRDRREYRDERVAYGGFDEACEGFYSHLSRYDEGAARQRMELDERQKKRYR